MCSVSHSSFDVNINTALTSLLTPGLSYSRILMGFSFDVFVEESSRLNATNLIRNNAKLKLT